MHCYRARGEKRKHPYLTLIEKMRKPFICLAVVVGAGVISPVSAGSSFCATEDFCAGFDEGYKLMKGDMVLVPLCPLEPLTPLGSTPFREGIKAGIRAASE